MPKAFTQCAFPFLRLQGNVRQGKGQRTGEEEEEEGGWLVVNLQMVETVQVAVLQKFLHLPPQADYTKEPFSFFALQPHIERDCSTNCSNISHPGSLSTFLTSLATSFIRTPFFSLLPFSPAAAHQGPLRCSPGTLEVPADKGGFQINHILPVSLMDFLHILSLAVFTPRILTFQSHWEIVTKAI